MLLVVGDPVQRGRLATYLREEDHVVVEAQDHEQVRDELMRERANILLVDVGSESVDGFELAEHARRFQPAIHVIYMSDWSVTARPVSGGIFLERPVRLPALSEALRWLWDAVGQVD